MALFVPFSTEKGTFIAGISSVIFAILIAFGELMGIKSLWIMPASLIFGVFVGIISSYIEVMILRKKKLNLESDTDSDCILIDRSKDGKYGGLGDLTVD